MRLQKLRIKDGVWTGRLQVDGDTAQAPQVAASHMDAAVPGVELAPAPDAPSQWLVTIPIPPAVMSEGVHTVLICDAATGTRLDHFTIVTGEPLEDDIRAEVALLRAELDMLKRTFRGHCRDIAG